jgi:hypothetical protein
MFGHGGAQRATSAANEKPFFFFLNPRRSSDSFERHQSFADTGFQIAA